MRAVSGNSHNPQQEPSSLSGPAGRSDLRIASPRAAVAFSGLALADSARKSFQWVLQRIIRFLQNSDVRNSNLGKSDLGCAADASKRTALTSAILILAISRISARAATGWLRFYRPCSPARELLRTFAGRATHPPAGSGESPSPSAKISKAARCFGSKGKT
jgi:hypothetical protein